MTLEEKGIKKIGDKLLIDLFPINRSVTGEGVRKTFTILKEIVNINIHEIPSGIKCADWKIPNEWNVKDAYIKTSSGKKIIDFNKNNLHLLNYSTPINKKLKFSELKNHLYSLPRLPHAIPYRTSYYSKNWGFCISYNQYRRLNHYDTYHVYIDSTLKPGSLTYADKVLKGTSGQEFLVTTYCCHPSMANDNVSGMVLWTLLLKRLQSKKTYHSYRFLIAPETIGSLAYLSKNKKTLMKVLGGFVITTVAGPGKFGYKRTFLGNHLIDRIVRLVFRDLKLKYLEYPFDIQGSDERQFSSHPFRIPIGTISKDKYYEYDYYHTSLDNLKFININNLFKTYKLYSLAIDYLEMNRVFSPTLSFGEPMFSKRALYPTIGGQINPRYSETFYRKNHSLFLEQNKIRDDNLKIIRWLMFYCDEKLSLLDISEKTGVSMASIYTNAITLKKLGLLKEQK